MLLRSGIRRSIERETPLDKAELSAVESIWLRYPLPSYLQPKAASSGLVTNDDTWPFFKYLPILLVQSTAFARHLATLVDADQRNDVFRLGPEMTKLHVYEIERF